MLDWKEDSHAHGASPSGVVKMAFRTRRNPTYPPFFLRLLGKKSDRELARTFGSSIHTVSELRRRRKIHAQRRLLPWTRQRLRMLGKYPDSVLARKWHCDESSI